MFGIFVAISFQKMTYFIDEYISKLDDKGRLVMPSAFRNVMPEGSDMRFVVRKDIFADCLEMYPIEAWAKQSREVEDRLDKFNKDHMLFWREYMRNRTLVEPDAKFGRITIPPRLLEAIGVTKEVVFFGNDYKIEIWAREKYEASAISEEQYLEIAGKLSQQR